MTESAKTIDCIICGSCVVDILVRPVPLETSIGGGRLIQVDPIEITTGGIVSNSGIAMSRLGMQAVALSYVGSDQWGNLLRERYHDEGFGADYLVTHPHKSHKHDCRVDRCEWRAKFCTLRGCTRATRPHIFYRETRFVCQKPHDAFRILLPDATVRNGFRRCLCRDTATRMPHGTGCGRSRRQHASSS